MTLASEKDAFKWELKEKTIKIEDISIENIVWFANEIRKTDRVKDAIKEKNRF